MSKSKFDKDGFQIVTSKRFSKKKSTLPPKNIQYPREIPDVDIDKALRKIQTSKEDLHQSKYIEDTFKSVSTFLQSRKIVEIVCFGLGHISDCNISRHQLAFLLCLRDFYSPEKVLVHDPVFYGSECDILKGLDIEVIDENREGSYIISDENVTLMYLPHCPKQLTNNFLWCNWANKLLNCGIICNSFTSLIENQPSRLLSETVSYIYRIHPYTSEIVLENNFKYTDIFNDTSLHYFTKENFEKLSSDFWSKENKPQYNDTEEFITKLMIEKLNI